MWDASGLGTGTGKTITGIGFTPKALVVLSHAATSATGSVQSTGYCYYNGATYVQGYHASGITTAPAGRTIASATQAFGSTTQATTQFVGAVTGFSSDTVTVNITTNAANTYCQFNVLIFA